MTTQGQTNNKVVKVYKDKRNSLSLSLNNEMLSQSLMLLLSDLFNLLLKLHYLSFIVLSELFKLHCSLYIVQTSFFKVHCLLFILNFSFFKLQTSFFKLIYIIGNFADRNFVTTASDLQDISLSSNRFLKSYLTLMSFST